jgi:FdhD protein
MSMVDVPIVRFKDQQATREDDHVAMEEPLEIFVDDEPYYVTMRLPGEELQLALGLCHSEGIIDSIDDTLSVNYCRDIASNRINVYLSPARKERVAAKLKQKRGTAYSSCGICGKEIVEDIVVSLKPIGATVSAGFAFLRQLQEVLRESQQVFHATGGTHAAAIFDRTGGLLALSEDVGRHNALDKAIGKVLFSRRTKDAAICMLSSRLSYEMVQKAARLGIEVLAGASAPTKLAVDLAQSVNLTLVGFLRKDRCNIYSCPERIALDEVIR